MTKVLFNASSAYDAIYDPAHRSNGSYVIIVALCAKWSDRVRWECLRRHETDEVGRQRSVISVTDNLARVWLSAFFSILALVATREVGQEIEHR